MKKYPARRTGRYFDNGDTRQHRGHDGDPKAADRNPGGLRLLIDHIHSAAAGLLHDAVVRNRCSNHDWGGALSTKQILAQPVEPYANSRGLLKAAAASSVGRVLNLSSATRKVTFGGKCIRHQNSRQWSSYKG
jgi:hypothetical protein